MVVPCSGRQGEYYQEVHAQIQICYEEQLRVNTARHLVLHRRQGYCGPHSQALGLSTPLTPDAVVHAFGTAANPFPTASILSRHGL